MSGHPMDMQSMINSLAGVRIFVDPYASGLYLRTFHTIPDAVFVSKDTLAILESPQETWAEKFRELINGCKGEAHIRSGVNTTPTGERDTWIYQV